MAAAIPFEPEHTFFWGSPLGIFLTLRGAHPVFEELRYESSLVSSFTLPTKSLYNIFHPSDPVAYRIEPLLLPQNCDPDDLPPPVFLTPPGKDVRLHLKAKQLGDVVRKSLFEPKKKSGWALLESAVSALGTEITATEGDDTKRATLTQFTSSTKFPLGGKSDRVDFSLQTDLINNDYISAVTAHSCYFSNKDILEFFIGIFAANEVKP